ncbi:MAG: dipeptide/oligopeptide/nickel ABC transporter ATP-binding protein [Defluviitaleaceae bacterium]|nr:dipeptide/oligopeptide/nickel ABC transporter ATP-binding protein [Defluviitaleaceae bacterium]
MTNILEVKNIYKSFSRNRKKFYAVEDVSLALKKGEVLGIVGESGCGKSTLASIIVRLLKEESGNIYFNGNDITNLKQKDLREIRKNIQVVFQDTYGSLNPSKRVGFILKETLDINTNLSPQEKEKEINEMLDLVGLGEGFKNRYPHELSGGERQRINIAAALILKPTVVIADEATSALDVGVQSQILNLMSELKKKLNLSYIFISHDLNVVYYMCDRIAVMKDGKVVEENISSEIFYNPKHNYTKKLFDTVKGVL